MRERNSRRSFLATLAGSAAALSLAARGEAQPAASPAAPPSGSASESPAPKPPSAAALAIAGTMRKFDAQLSDAEIESIARDIDRTLAAGAALNPAKRRLRNGDEPVTILRVESR
ncbi:MAG: hypothetical protein GIW95_07125 [Candidatus Eremiobacteraeota bacterium]|nr:hypothetical protein [Candidatus Eremiobacteraeota bacterium]